jgi:hypothetical protein
MLPFYLYLNSFLYLSFSIWCLVKFETTASFLGYDFVNNSGKVEYLTLYTGLQFGFAIFLGTCAYYTNFRLALYAGIVMTRVSAALYFGNVEKATYFVGALEFILCIWGILLLINQSKKFDSV